MTRLDFVAEVLRQEGKPYVWGADGPDAYDCSGLVCGCLHAAGGPDWRSTHNAQRLWDELPETTRPKPGDLHLYGRSQPPGYRATHVMVEVGDGRVFGACGGGPATTTPELAAAMGARVRYRQSPDYRGDHLGCRSLSQYLDKE